MKIPEKIKIHVLQEKIKSDIRFNLFREYKSVKLFRDSEILFINSPDKKISLEKYKCVILLNWEFEFIYRLINGYKLNKLNNVTIDFHFLTKAEYKIVVDYIEKSNLLEAISTYDSFDKISSERLTIETKLYGKKYFKNLLKYLIEVKKIQDIYPKIKFYY